MAMNPSPFFFVFLFLSTLFTATSVSSSTSPSYSHHCASTVPESTPTASSTTSFPYLQPFLFHCTGGDRILYNANDNISSEFSFEFEKHFWFTPTQNIFETNTTGVYKIEAELTVKAYNSLSFVLNGFWSEYSGKLCMVGSASWYYNEGNFFNLDAVLKLNYAKNLTIFGSLVTGKLESLASPDDPNYFEPISLFEFGTSRNYQYSLVSGEFDRDFRDGMDVPKTQSVRLNPRFFCGTMSSSQNDVLNLEYLNECGSLSNCTPLDKEDSTNDLPSDMRLTVIQCSEEEHKVQLLIKFGSGYQPFDLTTMLVGEGSWDEKKNQLYIVACRFVNSTSSLESTRVGDCSIRLSLRYPAFWTIRDRTSIVGQIWTNKSANEPGYFNRIAFRSRYNSMVMVLGMGYEYTVIEKVRKLCPFNKMAIKKGDRYPKISNDLAFYPDVNDSAGQQMWGCATVNFVGDQIFPLNPFSIPRSMDYTSHSILNVSYSISFPESYQTSAGISLKLPDGVYDMSAEGLYDEETGSLCMVGCRKLSTGESMDCEILLKFQFPPVNAKEGGKIRGSIESLREETDPLYFKQWEMTSMPYFQEEAERSVRPFDLEITMVVISYMITCVFPRLQLSYAKRNPQVLPFISRLMLLFLTLGYMIPLVLNFEDLLFRDQNRNNVFLDSGGWVEVDEVFVRVLAKTVAFLLHFRLLRLVFSARLGDENRKGLGVAEKKVLFVSIPVYILGLLFAVFLSTRKQTHSEVMVSSTSVVYHMHPIWRDLRSYGGLVLDGFLLPQILLNIFQISKMNALSPFFYIGTTCVRLVPRVYDLYRTHNYVRTQFDGAYVFANPKADYYSTAWDVVVSCWGVLFAIVIYLQQRFGGRCMFPQRFREVEVYEKVPVVSSDQ